MKKEKTGNTRRDFLKLGLTAAPAAAVATLATGEAAEAGEASGEGMRDTAHTRAYYESARF